MDQLIHCSSQLYASCGRHRWYRCGFCGVKNETAAITRNIQFGEDRRYDLYSLQVAVETIWGKQAALIEQLEHQQGPDCSAGADPKKLETFSSKMKPSSTCSSFRLTSMKSACIQKQKDHLIFQNYTQMNEYQLKGGRKAPCIQSVFHHLRSWLGSLALHKVLTTHTYQECIFWYFLITHHM